MILKDGFGIWNYSGSHPIGYRVHFAEDDGHMVAEKCEQGAVGNNIYKLRRLHCTHPSDPEFKRMICFLSGKLSIIKAFHAHCSYLRVMRGAHSITQDYKEL